MNEAEPHGIALGAKMVGHSAKVPFAGRDKQLPAPPAQSSKPELTRLTPISMTVGPVIKGGKSFFKDLGGVKDMSISMSEQVNEVPIMAPNDR
jgi:hypothetical protein